jgi:16S rRNA (cytosine967-C5)-methyltransferase
VVRRTLEEGAYADRALHGEARDLEPRERALAKRLAFGTVQFRGTLDWAIAGKVDRKLDPEVRAALHLGLYQLLFTEVAPHAAVSESVELIKPHPGAKLVNAVLRGVLRSGLELPTDDDPAGAAIRHGHPEWLVRLWWEWLGPADTRALLAANNRPAELAVRINRLVVPEGQEPDGLEDAADGREADARILTGRHDLLSGELYRSGAITPQSRASQRIAPIVDPQPGERVLDLCAAPGGKTTHLAALMGDRGSIVAVERNARRAQALQRQCERLRATCVEVRLADASDGAALIAGGAYDRVLLDPPCSGLGTLQHHPDLRWRMTPEAIVELRAQQERMIAAARGALAPGGRFVYSICTLSPAEEIPGVSVHRTYPHRDGTDGFYIAADG